MDESIQIDSNGDKKPRVDAADNDGGQDFISNMPESIISQILSLLPTKDALRTCVLSKDWEYKWTGIYNIYINDVDRFSLRSTRKTSVVNCVNRIFILSRNSNIRRFCLFCHQKYDTRRMITWISSALMRNVEELEIVYKYEGVVVPRCLFYCTRLTSLKLQMPCTFRPIQNWFSNLKVLYLAQVEILNEHAPNTNQLVFNFPILETFKLERCRWLNVTFVEIHAPSLTNFYVQKNSDLPEVDSFQIKISRAKLGKFEFHGSCLEKFDLSASSVFCASIDFHGYYQDIQAIRKNGLNGQLLLKKCSGLNHLQLSGAMVEAIVQSKQGSPLPRLNMVKHLEIFTSCSSEAFLEFLHSMPSLERVRLNVWLWDDYDYALVELIPSCILSHLKEVQFNGFKGEQRHVHMADFLLRNAGGLKKMSGLSRKKCEENQAEKNFWTRLKVAFRNGDFEVASSRKNMANMAEFERYFGS
ncbi:F-box/LRR-repeat protein At4g14103-like [Primulina huaijiensis]|uniref:F-box/LRR-repeat protein At4g14103-like n=1 Tax=Primulina huaijiensis TaxID=1492673 RepID=UPI003CC799BF